MWYSYAVIYIYGRYIMCGFTSPLQMSHSCNLFIKKTLHFSQGVVRFLVLGTPNALLARVGGGGQAERIFSKQKSIFYIFRGGVGVEERAYKVWQTKPDWVTKWNSRLLQVHFWYITFQIKMKIVSKIACRNYIKHL